MRPETLRQLRERGIILYNYYPDTSAFAHGALLPQALPEYDCIFDTKMLSSWTLTGAPAFRFDTPSSFRMAMTRTDIRPWPFD